MRLNPLSVATYAITTKYTSHGIRATCNNGPNATPTAVSTSYDHALNADENHAAAAKAVVEKSKFPAGVWTMGVLDDGKTRVFVLANGAAIPASEAPAITNAQRLRDSAASTLALAKSKGLIGKERDHLCQLAIYDLWRHANFLGEELPGVLETPASLIWTGTAYTALKRIAKEV